MKDERKASFAKETEQLKNDSEIWRTKYTCMYDENRKLRVELKNELNAYKVFEMSTKDAQKATLKGIGSGLLSGLLGGGSPTKTSGGGLGGLLSPSPTKTSGGGLGGLLGGPSPAKPVEQVTVAPAEVEKEKKRSKPEIDLWMNSEDGDDSSEKEIEKVFQIIEKKGTQVGKMDDLDSPTDLQDTNTLGFMSVDKTLTSSALVVDEKTTKTSVISEQKSSFQKTSVISEQKETVTEFGTLRKQIELDESVTEVETVTKTTDTRYEGTTKIETTTTVTLTINEATGEELDKIVDVEETRIENYVVGTHESSEYTEEYSEVAGQRKNTGDSDEFIQVDHSKKTGDVTPAHTGKSTPKPEKKTPNAPNRSEKNI